MVAKRDRRGRGLSFEISPKLSLGRVYFWEGLFRDADRCNGGALTHDELSEYESATSTTVHHTYMYQMPSS